MEVNCIEPFPLGSVPCKHETVSCTLAKFVPKTSPSLLALAIRIISIYFALPKVAKASKEGAISWALSRVLSIDI